MEPRVGYVTNTGGRGTLQVVWACLVTIGLCTWTVQRPNIVPFTKQRIPALARKQLFWMTLTIFCPEYVTYIAIDQWQNARKCKEIQKLGHPDFTIKQGFYVAMEGLIVRTYDDVSVGAGENHDSTKRGVPRDQKIYMDDLIILVREKILEPPSISLHSLEECSKTDNFARFITIYHVMILSSQLSAASPAAFPSRFLRSQHLLLSSAQPASSFSGGTNHSTCEQALLSNLAPKRPKSFVRSWMTFRFTPPNRPSAKWQTTFCSGAA